uniref:Thaumatin n=1 Tax=Steinernema glaseri TaxID=37863 RepID=A0A1I7Z1D2_9BILA
MSFGIEVGVHDPSCISLPSNFWFQKGFPTESGLYVLLSPIRSRKRNWGKATMERKITLAKHVDTQDSYRSLISIIDILNKAYVEQHTAKKSKLGWTNKNPMHLVLQRGGRENVVQGVVKSENTFLFAHIPALRKDRNTGARDAYGYRAFLSSVRNDSPRRRKPPALTSPSSPETTPNTTSSPTAAPTCFGPPNNPGVFIMNNVGTDAEFLTNSTKSCSCPDGTVHYFAGANETNPLFATGYGLTLECSGKKACVCVSPDECYQPSVDSIYQSIFPFCEGGSCALYLLASEPNNAGSMVPTKGSTGKAFTIASLFEADGETNKPLPGDYKKVTAIGCGECPKVMGC